MSTNNNHPENMPVNANQAPHNTYDRLEIKESPEILEVTSVEQADGVILCKKGTVGQDYEYEVHMESQPSEFGLSGKNIIFLQLTAPNSGLPNHLLAEYMYGDWHVLIPNGDNDLLMRAIGKLVDYYAPKD